MRVGLFDSGMGGLTVLKALMKRYPNNDYVYYGDNLNVPYGNKSVQELLVLADRNINFLISQNVDMIIVACGTISATCYQEIKDNYSIPIYDIISPTLDYLNKTDARNILVMATTRTIGSHIFMKGLNKSVYEIETPELASLIEANNLDGIDGILHKYLDSYVGKIDTLVLGCTHYPVLLPNIMKIFGSVNVIDMATILTIPNEGNGTLDVYFSDVNNMVIQNTKRILGNDKVIIKLATTD